MHMGRALPAVETDSATATQMARSAVGAREERIMVVVTITQGTVESSSRLQGDRRL